MAILNIDVGLFDGEEKEMSGVQRFLGNFWMVSG